MLVINATNVNHALSQGIQEICKRGQLLDSRAGKTLEIPYPVATVYHNPQERVLLSKVRDANPFFHFMESMWILAGRQDVKFLNEFNKRMGDYSDDGKSFNAPYGYRLRHGVKMRHDQLGIVIDILKKDPNSRQAVAQIWDEVDLNKTTKDKACNMSIIFRIRNGRLDITVCNRSNDMVWGAYGANAVQFSMIQEYVAAHIGIPVGTYTQVSNSFHVYTTGAGGALWDKLTMNYEHNNEPYRNVNDLVLMRTSQMDDFEHDLQLFFMTYDEFGLNEIGEMNCWKSDYFKDLVLPMLCIYLTHKRFGPEEAINHIHCIKADDWMMACRDWLEIRLDNLEKTA